MKRVLLGIVLGMFLACFLLTQCFALMLPEVLPERCVSIHGVICEDGGLFGEKKEESLLGLTQKLIELDRTEGDIRIYMHSPGGIVSIGLSLIDTIKSLKNDVQVLVHGDASSMAMYILAVGTKGKRAITKHTQILVHQMSFVRESNPEPMYPSWIPKEEKEKEWTEEEQEKWWEERWRQKYLRKIQITVDGILYKHTLVTPKELARWDDDIIFADTIIKYEIADGIWEGEYKVGTITEEVTE